jgi:hypothetical protein
LPSNSSQKKTTAEVVFAEGAAMQASDGQHHIDNEFGLSFLIAVLAPLWGGGIACRRVLVVAVLAFPVTGCT